jgi:hypothetical protein
MAAMRPLQERAEQGEAIDRRAYAAVVALLGEEVSDRFVTKLESGNREGGTTYYPVSAPAEAESEGEAPSWEPSFTMMLDAPAPMAVRDVVAALRAVGVEPPAVEVLDAVVEAWKVREWDAKVAPIGRELGEARRLLYLPSEDGQARRSEAMSASMQSALRRIADAMIAADIALCADLATALDLNPNGAGLLLLRLERLRLATATSARSCRHSSSSRPRAWTARPPARSSRTRQPRGTPSPASFPRFSRRLLTV